MPSKLRLQRIADRIQQELSQMLITRINDPRLTGITVTDVNIDRELAYAEIYVSAVEGSSRSREVLEGLEHANGFLRHELAAKVELRVFPHLRFHWDPTPENADHIEKLLESIRKEQLPTRKSEDEEIKAND